MKLNCISLVLVCIILSGCVFPYRYTVSPPVSGVVVNAFTGNPIPNAVVSISSENEDGIFHREYTTYSQEDGHFTIPAQKVTWIWIVPQEPYYPNAKLTVTAKGYSRYREERLGNPHSKRGKENTRDYTYNYLSGLRIVLQPSENEVP